jgi:hypothetical protein
MSYTSVGPLLDFLWRFDEAGARSSLADLERVGIPVSTRAGSQTVGAEVIEAPRSHERDVALIKLAEKALSRAISGFDETLSRVQGRIHRASTLRLLSAVMTTVLSSSVVASLQLDKSGTWGIFLGICAVLASILTLVATRLEGGEAKLAEGFAAISAKHAEARSLLDRLSAYAANPGVFNDIDQRLSEADAICAALVEWRAKVGIS